MGSTKEFNVPTRGLSTENIKLYLSLARDLEKASPPNADRGAFTELIRKLELGGVRRYRALGPRSAQWCRRLRNSYRLFQGDYPKLLDEYGSVSLLYCPRLRGAGRLIRRRGRLFVKLDSGAKVDLRTLTYRELDHLARSAHRQRGLLTGPVTSGPLFEVPRDLDEISSYLERKLKSLAPVKAVKVPRFIVRTGGKGSAEQDDSVRVLPSLLRLETLLAIYQDVVRYVREIPDSDAEEQRVTVAVRSRGKHELVGIPVRDQALAGRLRKLGRSRVSPRPRSRRGPAVPSSGRKR